MRVLISGTCAPALNSNYEIIEDISIGFQTIDKTEVKLVKITELTEAISNWKPDLTLLVGGLALETIPLAIVHHLCKKEESTLVFWSLEDPYELDWVLQQGTYFDLICTTDFSSKCFYPGDWIVKHLPLAAPRIPSQDYGRQMWNHSHWLFCGIPFQNRQRWIEKIQHNNPNGLVIGPEWPNYKEPMIVSRRRISRDVLFTLYKTVPITISIGRRYDLANSSKISPSTPGPRVFEAAGCRATQLVCESGLEISCYYEPNKEFLWARNIDEADDLLQRTSRYPAEVKNVGKLAWKRTQANHLYYHRAEKLLKWVNEL